VLLAGSASGEDPEHAVLHIKSNLAARGCGCGYRFAAGRFLWTGESRLRAADLLAAEAASEDLSSQDEALAFLEEILDGGPVPARKILVAAKQAGISERTLRRVKSREGIEALKVRYGGGSEWVWSIRPTSRSLPRLP
jgi:hypothetical protein